MNCTIAHRVRAASMLALFAVAFSSGCHGAPRCEGLACEGDAALDATMVDSSSEAGIDAGTHDATCEDLFASGTCAAHRLCDDSGAEPVCLEACEEGFLLQTGDGTCASCDVVACGPTCQDAVQFSIADMCAVAGRECVEPTLGAATCGGCLDRFIEDPDSDDCIAECGSLVCAPGSIAEIQAGQCVCEERPCGPLTAQSLDDPPVCTACGPDRIVCNPVFGELAVYPDLDSHDRCVCRTAPGYYWAVEQSARRCDADEDGWITRSAWEQYQSTDPTDRALARQGCTVRFVDRVVLRNEYGQTKTLYLCEHSTSETPCTNPEDPAIEIPLVEPERNDSDTNAPAYVDLDGEGRALRGHELNALTKACVTFTGDFDNDGVFDVEQGQPTVASDDPARRWAEFAFFMEIHTGRYVAPVEGETWGHYEIAERSRCTAGAIEPGGDPSADRFPLGYSPGTPTYWQSCERQRDVSFEPTMSSSGFDFARHGYACSQSECEPPAAPRAMPHDGLGGAPEPHGLCNALAAFPDNGVPWLGMQHYSQFKCVRVGPEAPIARIFDAMGNPTGDLDFQSCLATAPSADPNVDLACSASMPDEGDVGWAALRYTAATKHARGCVDERTLDGVCGVDSLPAPPVSLLGFTQDDADFGRILSCPKFCGRYAQLETCSVDGPIDEDCDGTADNVIVDDSPNLVHSCNSPSTFSVPFGSPSTFNGTVDANGPDFVRVRFPTTHNSTNGVGTGFRTRVELVNGSGTTHIIDTPCGSGSCGGGGTVIESFAPNNPNGCRSQGNCSDATSSVTEFIVRVRRRPEASAICTNGVPTGYSLRVTNTAP